MKLKFLTTVQGREGHTEVEKEFDNMTSAIEYAETELMGKGVKEAGLNGSIFIRAVKTVEVIPVRIKDKKSPCHPDDGCWVGLKNKFIVLEIDFAENKNPDLQHIALFEYCPNCGKKLPYSRMRYWCDKVATARARMKEVLK